MPTSTRPTPLLALTALVAMLAVATSAAEAKPAPSAGQLRPTAVRAGAVAQPGGPLNVRVVVSASGKAKRAGGVAIYLSKDAKRSKDDVRIPSAVKTPKAAKGKIKLTASVKLPATQPVGAVRVIACVNESSKGGAKQATKDCRAAKAPLNVVATVQPSDSPQALIAADLAAGRIRPDQALAYRVFAVFGDDRLPANYAGGATAEGDDGIMRELASAWPTLSPGIRKQVGKYFLPTPLRDATPAERKAGGAKKRTTRSGAKGTTQASRLQDAPAVDEFEDAPEADPSVCDTEYFKPKSWQSKSAAGGKVRVWWRTDRPDDGKDVGTLVDAISAAYPKYQAILDREPQQDGDVDCYHGPDAAIDVYIDRVVGKSAITVPSVQATGMQADCEGYPGFIVTNPTDSHFTMQFVIAHELFHLFQMSYAYAQGCKDYSWFDEGSANWAAHSVFPADNSEHLWTAAVEYPSNDIAQDYESWPFMLWMERTLGTGSIRKTYEGFRRLSAYRAVDAAIGTWRTGLLDFAKHGWNQTPYPSFASWDGLGQLPKPRYKPVEPISLLLLGQTQRTAHAPFAVDPRGRDYKRFTVPDEKIREITFKNPLAGNADARIGAILTLAGGGTRWEDWSGKSTVRLCRDEADQNVTEIVLVYANSSDAERWSSQLQGEPELALRDTCDDLPWHFKIQSANLTTHLDGQRAAGTSTVCPTKGYATRDQFTFTAVAGLQGFTADKNVVKKRSYGDALEGRFQAKAPGAKWEHTLTGCQYPYENPGITKCQTTRTEHATGDWTLGFSLAAASRKASSATLTWHVGSVIGGYFDADDSVCNVFSIDQTITDDSLVQSQVAMSTLEGTAPFTLTLKGSTSWNVDAVGKPVSLTYDWDYAITLQRVNADGSPLG